MSELPKIFDRAAYAQRRERAGRIGTESFLLQDVAAHLAERLSAVKRHFGDALDLGSRPQSLKILHPFSQRWTAVDISADEFLAVPAESLDLAVSVLSLHAVNDLPGMLLQIRRALRPDGLFIAAMFAGDTLRELRESFAAGESDVRGGASLRVAPFADLRDLGSLLQRAGFALPVADSERTVVRYREFTTLISDLRSLGETNALSERSTRFLRRDVLGASLAHYKGEQAESNGRLRVTFDIAYLTGWAPHASQQKPLKPGSAKMRLADALGSVEQPAGDKTSPGS